MGLFGSAIRGIKYLYDSHQLNKAGDNMSKWFTDAQKKAKEQEEKRIKELKNIENKKISHNISDWFRKN